MNWFLENHQGGWKLEARGWRQLEAGGWMLEAGGAPLPGSVAAAPDHKLGETQGTRE